MKNKFLALQIYTNLVYMFTLSLARQMRFGGCTRNLRRLDQSVWLFSIRKVSCKLIDRRSSDDGIEERTSRNCEIVWYTFIGIIIYGTKASHTRLGYCIFLNELHHQRIFAFALTSFDTWITIPETSTVDLPGTFIVVLKYWWLRQRRLWFENESDWMRR